jgi:hypothetical protein
MSIGTEPTELSTTRANLQSYGWAAEEDMLRFYEAQHDLETADAYRAHIGEHAVKLARSMRWRYKHPMAHLFTRNTVELDDKYVGGDCMRYSVIAPPEPNTVVTAPMFVRRISYKPVCTMGARATYGSP